MKPRTALSFLLACASLMITALTVAAQEPRVQLTRTPSGGIQPQAIVDAQGTLHLLYFHGEAKGGDVFYTQQKPGAEKFSAPLRVNSESGSAMAIGSIRGAQFVLGRGGRVHVAWNGSKPAPNHAGPAMFYTRLNDAGTGFEPQRDLITVAAGLDGGGSVAADPEGRVYVLWHAAMPGNTNREAGRAVFIARSTDDGATFTPETRALKDETGACACCGMRAFAAPHGNLFALYRAARENVNRDEVLMVSRNHGADFSILSAHPWKVPMCPMSSASFSANPSAVLAAWETEGRVYFARVNPQTLAAGKPITPPGAAKRKHPVTATNARGETLLAWTEGTGWQQGGAVAWQRFDAEGRPGKTGRAEGVPVWSFVAAVPTPDGGFTIFY